MNLKTIPFIKSKEPTQNSFQSITDIHRKYGHNKSFNLKDILKVSWDFTYGRIVSEVDCSLFQLTSACGENHCVCGLPRFERNFGQVCFEGESK